MQLLWVWNPKSQFRMLHCIEIHFEALQVDNKNLRPIFNHHLPGCDLFCITRFTKELVS